MIRLTDNIPEIFCPKAEYIRLRSIFECYSDTALFWEQDEKRAFICLLDGDMTICCFDADILELKQFLRIISPASIFTDENTLSSLEIAPYTVSHVMLTKARSGEAAVAQELKSAEIYRIFNAAGLELPPYEYFAVDICRRVNRSFADFYLSENAAAYSIHSGGYALIQGIASLKKGEGSVALRTLLQKNSGRTVLACCRKELRGFYEKNGFKELYTTAQWIASPQGKE